MVATHMAEEVSPKLLKVTERAKRNPQLQFLALEHLVDQRALKAAFGRIRKEAAVGVDGITKEQYGERLDENVSELHKWLRTQTYRHKPIRRVHIPKGQGKTRPIGISTCWRGLSPRFPHPGSTCFGI